MKKFIIFALLISALDSAATERSITIYEKPDFLGSYADFYDELFLGIGTHVTQNGKTSWVSHLEPVGEKSVSSVEVTNGYCGLLTSDLFLEGSWRTLNPGRYPSLSTFDNKTQSVLIYKMMGEQQVTCNPLKDIPVLYDGANQTGQAFPVTINNGYNANAKWPFDSPRFSGLTILWADQIQNGGYSQAFGGFMSKASSMSVPPCYKIRSGIRTFGPGNYNLAEFGLNNNLNAVEVIRENNCKQPAPIITPPVTADCGPNHLQIYNGGQLVFVKAPDYSFPVDSINAFCGSCGFRTQSISYYPGANLVYCK